MVEYIRSLRPIILVRHGQAHSNVDPSIGGWQDPGLTSLGRLQAKAAAKRLAKLLEGRKVDIYTSHLRRAHETADYICQELGHEPTIEESLQEYQTNIDPEISRTEAQEYRIERVNPVKDWKIYRDAESVGEMYLRAGEVLSRIMESDHDIILIISHGWLIDKMISWWMGISEDDIRPNMFTTANASISILTVSEHGERVLLKLNDTAHLKDLTEEESILN
jgi:probable phosphoglycerate mutase